MTGRIFSTHVHNPESIDALHDGVPVWMKSSLDGWITEMIQDINFRAVRADVEKIKALERLLRADLSSPIAVGMSSYQTFFHKINASDDLKLDVTAGLLQIGVSKILYGAGADELEYILHQSGSKWRVADLEGAYHLEERVDETATSLVEEAAETNTDSSSYLVKAWNSAFGRSPDSSNAYSNAIKAIEAASWKVVIPNDNRATLGKIINELREHPDMFEVSTRELESDNAIVAVYRSMRTVWDGQTDRHGTANPVTPTQGAAEQAVFIALSITQQFERGLVNKKSK